MARLLTRRRYIKYKARLQKPTKPSKMSFLVSTVHIVLIEGSLPICFEYGPRGIGHFGQIFNQTLPSHKKRVLVRIELRGAIVELAKRTKIAWSSEHSVQRFTCMLTSTRS